MEDGGEGEGPEEMGGLRRGKALVGGWGWGLEERGAVRERKGRTSVRKEKAPSLQGLSVMGRMESVFQPP